MENINLVTPTSYVIQIIETDLLNLNEDYNKFENEIISLIKQIFIYVEKFRKMNYGKNKILQQLCRFSSTVISTKHG